MKIACKGISSLGQELLRIQTYSDLLSVCSKILVLKSFCKGLFAVTVMVATH